MGTTRSNLGPPDSNQLLPPDAPPAPIPEESEQGKGDEQEGIDPDGQTADKPQVEPYEWQHARREATRYVNEWNEASMTGGGYPSPRNVTRSFTRAQGGAGGATNNSRRGVKTAARLVGFLASVARDGVSAATEALGFTYVGRSASAVLNDLASKLTFPGAIGEDSVARTALLETMRKLFKDCAVQEGGFEGLEALTPDAIREIIRDYVTNFINAQLMHFLASKSVESNAVSVDVAFKAEKQIKGYVYGLVKLELKSVDVLQLDWTGSSGQTFMKAQFEKAFTLIS